MKVLITGATGLIGKELVELFKSRGFTIHYLTTSKEKLVNERDYKGFYWNPENREIDTKAFEGAEAIVHLAGASISKRWTKSYKKEIIDSRTLSGELLYNTLKNIQHNIKYLVSASAIGIYQDSLTIIHDEASQNLDHGFLADVVSHWEESIDKFNTIEIKTCKLRTGLVLSKNGGALPEMIRPINWGFGAALGSGKQIYSWIHINDLTRMYLFVLENKLNGIFNAVAPNAVSNREFTEAIARQLNKPLILPNIPKFILSLTMGEMQKLLVSSQSVSSQKIQHSGFGFKFKILGEALDVILK